MLRWFISLSVVIALLAISSEAMAQRRQPIRNFAKSIGAIWGTGNHYRNPGPNIGYYSPYSQHGTPTPATQGDIPQNATGTTTINQWNPRDGQTPIIKGQINQGNIIIPAQPTHITPSNSATQLFISPGIRQTTPRIDANIDPESSIFNTNTEINQHLKPYQGQTRSRQSITILPESNWTPTPATTTPATPTPATRTFPN